MTLHNILEFSSGQCLNPAVWHPYILSHNCMPGITHKLRATTARYNVLRVTTMARVGTLGSLSGNVILDMYNCLVGTTTRKSNAQSAELSFFCDIMRILEYLETNSHSILLQCNQRRKFVASVAQRDKGAKTREINRAWVSLLWFCTRRMSILRAFCRTYAQWPMKFNLAFNGH